MKPNIIITMLLTAFLIISGVANAQVEREPLAVSQKTVDGILVAYPNPARDNIWVKSKDNTLRIKSVTFYSILGMQVATYPVNANAAEINIEKLRPGKYLMRYVLSDETQKVTQIIKQ
jgi:hypothetical protein